jgi:hypothetical protein
MQLNYIAMTTDQVQSLRTGAPDSYGQTAEVSVSDGDGNPCRHCLAEIALDQPMLILAHRPFATLQAYAETGPIFLCARECERHPDSTGIPELYRHREMLIRGYDRNERIVYGTGKAIDMRDIEAEAGRLFEHQAVEFIHVRSSTNNCYHFRIEQQLK